MHARLTAFDCDTRRWWQRTAQNCQAQALVMMWRVQAPLPSLSALTSEPGAELLPRLYSTVVSWGRNLEGQAGIEGTVVVTRPTPILELHDHELVRLAASKLTSAAVTQAGDMYTWGDGWGGKLGHGSGDSLIAPTRVESLVSKARMLDIAVGDHHSLMLDRHGQVWACGENKEGQCGLGTPMEVVAQQRHQAFSQLREHHATAAFSFLRVNPPAHQAAVSYDDSAGAVFSRGVTAMLRSYDSYPSSSARLRKKRSTARQQLETLWSAHQHQAASLQHSHSAQAATWAQGLSGSRHTILSGSVLSSSQQIQSHGWGAKAATLLSDPASALLWGGSDLSAYLTGAGAQPGHQCTPVRLGRDLHPLAHPGAYSDLLDHSQLVPTSVPASNSDGPHIDLLSIDSEANASADGHMTDTAGRSMLGISGQHVTQVATSRHFSLAVTAQGQVWAWGACFEGCLGPHNQWATAPQRVDGELASVLEDQGGAVSVAAGGTFALATTRSGKVVVWGSLPAVDTLTPPIHGVHPAFPSAAQFQAFLSSLMLQGHASKQRAKAAAEKVRLQAGVVEGLPAVTQVAAGQQHAVLTDGQRVWVVGRCVDAANKAGLAAPWNVPLEVFDASSLGGVKCVRAGAHSSAIVTGNGQLWMWGRLLDAQQASVLLQRAGGSPRLSPWQDMGSLMWDDVSLWQWPGFGAARPTRVTGLPGPVRDVALGGWHAMAVIE